MKRCKSTNCHARASRFRRERLPACMIASAQCVRARSDHSFRTLRREKWNGKAPTERSADEDGSKDQGQPPTNRRAQSSEDSRGDTRILQDAAPFLALPSAEMRRRARKKILGFSLAMTFSVDQRRSQPREAPPESRRYW